MVTPPELFRRHLEVLAEESSPISLGGLIDGLPDGVRLRKAL